MRPRTGQHTGRIVSDLLSFTPQTTAGLYGTLTLNAAGAYTYTLNNSLSVVQALGQGESLSETFNYTVKDQHGGITVGTLTVNISGTNDCPCPRCKPQASPKTSRP